MLKWYDWFVFVLMVLILIFGSIIIYQGLVGSSTVFIPLPTPLGPTAATGATFTGSSSNFNCGGTTGVTGSICLTSLGQSCINGQCQCVNTGFTFCPNGIGCVNLQTSPFSCGECGHSCGADSACCGGECVNITTINDCGECGNMCVGVNPRCCQNNCVDVDSSFGNCSACLQSCAEGQRCCGGECSGPNDRNNCSECGDVCSANEVCFNNQCIPGCETGFTLCSGTCVSLETSNFNCNNCGVVCPAGTFCQNSNCVSYACQTDTQFCPATNGCTSLSTNYNCGGCGVHCPLACSGSPVGTCMCHSTPDCNSGATCNLTTGLCVNPNCPIGTVFCGDIGQCVTLSSSAVACGGCAVVCTSGSCVGGKCTCSTAGDCPLGQDCVSGICAFH